MVGEFLSTSVFETHRQLDVQVFGTPQLTRRLSMNIERCQMIDLIMLICREKEHEKLNIGKVQG